MSLWVRKHSAELATGIRSLLDDPLVPEAQRDELRRLYGAAKELATMPMQTPERRMADLMNDVCRLCGGLERFDCCGRLHWTTRCALASDANA